MKLFDQSKPWFVQLQKFCAQLGFVELNRKKVALAERLASGVEDLPPTYVALEKLIRDVDNKASGQASGLNVVLRKVRGITD